MDVAILAGGRGTRLAGVWSGPKCLAPFAGKPVLGRILERVKRLYPNTVHLLLGHKAEEVLTWLAHHGPSPLWLSVVVDKRPLGTCGAFRQIISGIEPPVLVLNGDTLPGYDYASLIQFYETVKAPCAAAWCGEHYAGAMVLGKEMLEFVSKSEAHDFDASLFLNAARYRVPSFFDIGTPESFHKAQHVKSDDV